MQRSFLTRALAVFFMVSASAFANLVENPGFETGSFAPEWTTVLAASGSNLSVFGLPNSGTNAAAFGASDGLDDAILQTLVTSAGQQYTFSFWLDASQGVEGNFMALWDGSQIFSTGAVAGGYQFYSFLETASSNTTVIGFAGNTPPSFYNLDDVCVDSPAGNCAAAAAVPEPSSLWLMMAGSLALGFARKRWA